MAHGAHALTPFHIAGDQNGEPQEFINDQGDFVGPFVTTMRAVFDQLGLPLRHDPYEWQAAQDLVRDGGADALITVLTPARAEYLVSNQVALAELNWVVTVRGDHPQRDELLAKTRLEDFVGYEVLDYAGNGWGIANLGGLNVTREGTIADNLRKLATGTGDLLINLEGGTEQTVAGLLQTNPTDADAAELQALVTGSNVLGVSEMNLLVRKDSPYVDLIPQIDAVLRTLLGDQSAVSVPVNTPWLLWSLVLALALVAQRRLRA
jgi:polar amino acid transport system substrate-binding protein